MLDHLSWSIVKVLHEERVNGALRAKCLSQAYRVTRPTRTFRFFENSRHSRANKHQPVSHDRYRELCCE